jgi:hypothetical protein
MSLDMQKRIAMPRERYKPEELVAKSRQADVMVSLGRTLLIAGPGYDIVRGE